jgi:hypothetical protein
MSNKRANNPQEHYGVDEKKPGQTYVLRIYEDAQGNSHMEEIAIATKVSGNAREGGIAAATGISIREYQPRYLNDWHTTPMRKFGITIVGELEVEVSGGVKRRVRTGELVFLEDTKGKGHITRIPNPATNLFITVPDSFDVVAWAMGED